MSAPATRSYIICTSPRSGSTLLCALLKETGIAGRPGSLFHEPSLDKWLAYYNLSDTPFDTHDEALRAVIAKAKEKGTGTSNMFGLRLQRRSFPFFMKQIGRLHPGFSSDVERIEAEFGPTQFFYLNRTDKIAQAVSLVVAEQSGLWHRASDGSELERVAPPQEPQYDRAAIAGHLSKLAGMDVEWNEWFVQENVEPLRIDYSALSQDPQGILAEVLNRLGLDPAIAHSIPTPTAKLADELSREWIERFGNERAD